MPLVIPGGTCGGDAAILMPAAVSFTPLAAAPPTLVWTIAILAFGVLLMVCVLLLLWREADPSFMWESGTRRKGQHLQHLNRLLRAIRAINSLVLAERDGMQLLEKACRSLTTTRGYRMAWIGLVRDGTKRVDPVTQAGFGNGYLDQIEVTWDDTATGKGPTGRAIKTAEPYAMRDIESAPEFEPWREQALERGYRSSAALPLRFEGTVLGALSVYSEMPEAFDIEEVGLLQEVADHLAYALGSIRLEAELAEVRRQKALGDTVCAAFDRAPFGIIVTDGDGTVTGINRHVLALLGCSEDASQIIARLKLSQLDGFGSVEARGDLNGLFADGQDVAFQIQARDRDGQLRTLSCRGMPIGAEDGPMDQTLWLVEEA